VAKIAASFYPNKTIVRFLISKQWIL
jgi:hypothetical protein